MFQTAETSQSELNDQIHELPKVDLHRHLDGSMRPETIVDVAHSYNIDLPTYDAEKLRSLVKAKPATTLVEFLYPWGSIFKYCFPNREVISRLAREVVEDAWKDNVYYLELRFSPEYMAVVHQLRLQDVIEGVIDGVETATKQYPTVVKLIISISRQCEARGWALPQDILRAALEYSDCGIVGLDLGGHEAEYPAEMFESVFREAKEKGLMITAHAGEALGAASIESAIEHLCVDRIGHGVRILEDMSLVRRVKEKGICLEMCPTSNVLTGATPSLESHPIRRLYDMGVKVTVNTDDPVVCDVTLTDEFQRAARVLGFSLIDIRRMIGYSLECCFLSKAQKTQLIKERFSALIDFDDHSQDIGLQ